MSEELSTTLTKSWKVIETELEDGKLPDDVTVLQRFLYESIGFLARFKDAGDTDNPHLGDWLDVIKQLMPKVTEQFSQLNLKGLKFDTVLVYLNHLTYHLVQTKTSSLENIKFLAVTMFYLLCSYIHTGVDADNPDLVPNIAHQTYSVVCAAGQRVQKSTSSTPLILRRCYELYFLAAACLNLDCTNKCRNGMKTATDFISAYVDWHSRVNDLKNGNTIEDMDFTSALLGVAVRAYTAQPRDMYGDACLGFFMELFKLSKWRPVMAKKLFACDGNLFDFKVDDSLLTFSNAPSEAVRAANLEVSINAQFPVDYDVKNTVMSLLHLSQIMAAADVKDDKSSAELEKNLEKHSHFDRGVQQIFAFLRTTARPVRSAVASAVFMVVKMFPPSEVKEHLHVGTLRLCYRLSSLAVCVMVREVIAATGNSEQASKLQTRVYNLALVCKIRLTFLHQFVAKVHSDMNEMSDIASYLKPCLNALTNLIVQVKKKKLIEQDCDLYRQVYKCLDCAVYNIGSLGRNLRRYEEHSIAIALLSGLWPCPPELTSLVTYHETLVLSYKQNGEVEKALQVIRESAALDRPLLTDTLIKALVKIMEQKPTLDLITFYKCLEHDGLRHSDALDRTVRVLLNGQLTPGVVAHCQKLLEELRSHWHLLPSKRSIYTFLLAELLWTSEERADMTLERCSGKAFILAQEAMDKLAKEVSGDFDDFFSQSVFLVWEMMNRTACLKSIAKMRKQLEAKSQAHPQANGDATVTTTPTEPEPPSVTNPPESTARQHCYVGKTDLIADLHFDLTSDKKPGGGKPGAEGGESQVDSTDSGVDVEGKSSDVQTLANANIDQVDSDVLMFKARECLTVWIRWYKNFQGEKHLKTVVDSYRADRSLRFLTRVADLAMLCHQPKPAVEALCQARSFALWFNKEDTAKRVTGTLVYALAQFGLPLRIPPMPSERRPQPAWELPTCKEREENDRTEESSDSAPTSEEYAEEECGSKPWESDGKLSADDLWALEQLGLTKDCHILQLISLAFHYLRSKQNSKFFNLRSHIMKRIAEQRAKGPLTPNCSLTLSIMHRLTAEFFTTSLSQHYRAETSVHDGEFDHQAEPYPLESISDALKYITSVGAFYLGDNFRDARRGVSPEAWRLFNEYLTNLKIQGDLYIQVGNMKYARTHLIEGLKISMSCLLSTWTAIFLSRLAEISMEFWEKDMRPHMIIMQSAAVILAYRCRRQGVTRESLKDDNLCSCMKQERDWSAFGKTRVKWMEQHAKEKAERWSQGHCTCCSKGDAKEVRERLTQLPKDPTPSDEHDDLTKVLLRRNDYWCDIVLHLHDTPPTVLPRSYILDEDKHPPAPKPEINNENSFVYGYSHHFAPLMVDCERCDLCHQPEMTEARVRLLCIHGEILARDCKLNNLNMEIAAQSFQFARCAASRSGESGVLEAMANKALSEAQLSHLSVMTCEYRQMQPKALALSVEACWHRVDAFHNYRGNDELLQDIYREAQAMKGAAGSHVLEATAMLVKAQPHHKAVRDKIVHPTPADHINERTLLEHSLHDSIAESVLIQLQSWQRTLENFNVYVSVDEILGWGLYFNGIDIAEDFAIPTINGIDRVNPGVQEAVKNATMVGFMARPYLFSTDSKVPCNIFYSENYTVLDENSRVPWQLLNEQRTEKVPGQSNVKAGKKTATSSKRVATGNTKKLQVTKENRKPEKCKEGDLSGILDRLSLESLKTTGTCDNASSGDVPRTPVCQSDSASHSMDLADSNSCTSMKTEADKQGGSKKSDSITSSSSLHNASPMHCLQKHRQLMETKNTEKKSKRKGGKNHGAEDEFDSLSVGPKGALVMSDPNKQKQARSSRCKGKHQTKASKENAEGSQVLMETSTELTNTVKQDRSRESATIGGSSTAACDSKKAPSRARRFRAKDNVSPECSRHGDENADILLNTPDSAITKVDVLERLAPSPDSESRSRSPRGRNFNLQTFEERGSFSSPEGEQSKDMATMSQRSPTSSFLSHHPELPGQGGGMFHRLTGAEHSNRNSGYSSPPEIPRGRPQRTRRAVAKTSPPPVEDNDEQAVKTPSPGVKHSAENDVADKENMIQCTPEREIGKSPFPLITPKSKAKSKLSQKKSSGGLSKTVIKKRAALMSRDDAENISANEGAGNSSSDPAATTSVTGAQRTTGRRAAKVKDEALVTEFEPPEETIKRRVGRPPRRAATRGKTAGAVDVVKNDPSKPLCKRRSDDGIGNLSSETDMSPSKQNAVQHGKEDAQRESSGNVNKQQMSMLFTKVPTCPEDCHPVFRPLFREPTEEERKAVMMSRRRAERAERCSSSFTVGLCDCERCLVGRRSHDLQKAFPTLIGYDDNENFSKVQGLDRALRQNRHFPPAFMYGQLCRALAMQKWERCMTMGCHDMWCHGSISAYLMASMHLTFQHMLTRNLRTKLRRREKKRTKKPEATPAEPSAPVIETDTGASDDEWLGEEQLAQDKQRLSTAAEHIAFRGHEVEIFGSFLENLPPDYTVVQLSVVDLDPLNPKDGIGQVFVTRITPDLAPLTVAIPLSKNNTLIRAVDLFEKVMLAESRGTSEDYWERRHRGDKNLKAIVDCLQSLFLSSHIWLMHGRVHELIDNKMLQSVLDKAATVMVALVAERHGGYCIQPGIIRALLDCLLFANELDICTLLQCMWDTHIAHTLCLCFERVQRELLSDGFGLFSEDDMISVEIRGGLSHGPVVLILDKTLTRLPWESMTALMSETVTRVPSLASLKVLLTMHKERVDKPRLCGVDQSDAVAVVDPENNLENSAQFLLPQFTSIQGWTCLFQKPPTVSDLKAILEEHSLYVYCGHGWGKQFVGGEDLQMFRAKAAAIIMGCFSNRLDHRPRVDGDGAPLYFLMAGCPAVMGNLWVVTDRDIDKLTTTMVSMWFNNTNRFISLALSLNRARFVCKLFGFNGSAPVIYGLPTYMVDRKVIPLPPQQ